MKISYYYVYIVANVVDVVVVKTTISVTMHFMENLILVEKFEASKLV